MWVLTTRLHNNQDFNYFMKTNFVRKYPLLHDITLLKWDLSTTEYCTYLSEFHSISLFVVVNSSGSPSENINSSSRFIRSPKTSTLTNNDDGMESNDWTRVRVVVGCEWEITPAISNMLRLYQAYEIRFCRIRLWKSI